MIIVGHSVIAQLVTKSTLLSALRYLIDNGTTCSQIARAFGVSHACVSQWLSGKRVPSAMACRLAEYVLSQPHVVEDGLPGSVAFVKPVYEGHKRKRGRPRKAK